MTTVFLATLGQRPTAITMALDALHPRYRFEGVDILHTDPEHSDIAAQMTKSVKTIETQLSSIYDKRLTHFALNVNPKQKRRALIDILNGRV